MAKKYVPRLSYDVGMSDAAVRPPTSGMMKVFMVGVEPQSYRIDYPWAISRYVTVSFSTGNYGPVYWSVSDEELDINPIEEAGPTVGKEARDGSERGFLAPTGPWFLNCVCPGGTVRVELHCSDASRS